jgi:hypothetical protein
MYDTTLEFKNPRSRHLHLHGRKSNIFQLIAETFWVMAGANAVTPYLDFFLPRAKNYSDDGVTWHGAYGPRLHRYSQFQTAVDQFRNDGINTRRSFVTIADPTIDNLEAIEAVYGEGHVPKDIPCNRELHFYVENGEFHTKCIQRSGDLLFGTGSINPFEFSFIHELMYNEVKKIHPTVKLGSYRWHVTNAHVYSDFIDQFDAVLEEKQNFHENDVALVGPVGGHLVWEHFFSELIAQYGSMITQTTEILEAERGKHWNQIEDIFDRYAVGYGDLMYEYAALVYGYILSKKGVIYQHRVTRRLQGDLLSAVTWSPFRKFNIME